MFRWLLVGLLLLGMGVVVDKGWVEANWRRIQADLRLPGSNWSEDLYKTKEEMDIVPKPARYRTFRDLIKAE